MCDELEELIKRSMLNDSDERPTEYEFVWKWLAILLPFEKKVKKSIKLLDVGGAESRLAKTLAELGFDTTVIDIADLDHGKAKFVKANILEYDFHDNEFDIIISISTIEHVGLTCYGQTIQDFDGDIKTVNKIHRWLKPNGIAIVTLPYGKPHHPPTFERVYDSKRIKELFPSDLWQTIDIKYACKKIRWEHSSEEEARKYDAVVMLVLQKK